MGLYPSGWLMCATCCVGIGFPVLAMARFAIERHSPLHVHAGKYPDVSTVCAELRKPQLHHRSQKHVILMFTCRHGQRERHSSLQR